MTMRWLKSSSWSTCLLSAAAASALATPLSVWAESPSSAAVPRQFVSSEANRANTLLVAQAGETDVQRELRRLYEESGREMPELQTQGNIQFQRPQGDAAAATTPMAPSAPVKPQVQATAPAQPVAPSIPQPVMTPHLAGPQPGVGGTPPVASAPRPGSRNPVTAFFKRLVPGGQSKPEQTAAPVPPSRPAVPMQAGVAPGQPANAPSYAPYSGQQPRRLANAGEVAPAPAIPPSPTAAPAPTAAPMTTTAPVVAATPKPQAQPKATVASKPPVVPQARPTATVVATAQPEFRPAVAPPTAAPRTATAPAMPLEEQVVTSKPSVTNVKAAPEPEFAPPLVVEEATPAVVAESAPALTVPTEPVLAAEVASVDAPAAEPAATGDFPDPFPEMSEEDADDELDVQVDSPFVGLPLEEEPDFGSPEPKEQVATSEEPDPFDDPLLDQPVLTPPAAAQGGAPVLPEKSSAAPELVMTPETAAPARTAEPSAESDVPMLVDNGPDAEPSLDLPEPPTLPAPNAGDVTAVPATAPQELPKPTSYQPSSETEAKMALIRERGGMKGLKGFCPVTLRDDRELKDSRKEFSASFRGQKFHFATAAAQQRFDAEPARYVPAAYGADVVILIRDKDVAEGSLDHAAWFKGRLYLFSSEASHQTFVSEPAKYAAPAGLDE